MCWTFTETIERDFGEPPPEEGGLHQQYLQRQRQDGYNKGKLLSRGIAPLNR